MKIYGYLILIFLFKPFYDLFHYTFIGPLDYETVAKLKIFYLKLDLIGEQYVKEYEDKSSHQFKKLSAEIIEGVYRITYVIFRTDLLNC